MCFGLTYEYAFYRKYIQNGVLWSYFINNIADRVSALLMIYKTTTKE